MSDYTITTDFSPKDVLPVSDPEKLILGADIDVELDAIQVAIASKYDNTDIATQAQAEAGVSNEVLITPLRLVQYLNQSLAGGAGIVPDLIALTDPGADRILFWDDSENAAGFLQAGTGLTITGTVLTVDESVLNHDLLTGFVANEHIDHTAVTITAGAGLSYSVGGTNIASSATIDLDISDLTAETSLDFTSDYLAFYDASATTTRKVTLGTLLGDELGDGKWWRSGDQSITASTPTTIVFNTIGYDNLTRGTFSTSTGQYTRGTDAGRIFVGVNINVADINDDNSFLIEIQVNSVTQQRYYFYSDTDNDNPELSRYVGSTLNLAASDVVRIRVTISNNETIQGDTIAYTNISIIELS